MIIKRVYPNRLQELSGASYGLLMGLIAAVGIYAVSNWWRGLGVFGPIGISVLIGIVYYAFDPNN